MRFLSLVALVSLSACSEAVYRGDSGCVAYGEARSEMPRQEALPASPWGYWIADLDDRMRGTCL